MGSVRPDRSRGDRAGEPLPAAATTWGISAADAADRLVRDWRLYRVPDLGVVVNVC